MWKHTACVTVSYLNATLVRAKRGFYPCVIGA